MEILDSIDLPRLRELKERDEFTWLDIAGPTDEQLRELAALHGWHPLLLEDLREFGQRPKLDAYPEHVLLVFYGARLEAERPALTEVHIVLSGQSITTVRHAGCHELEQLHARLRGAAPKNESELIYRVLDTLTDSFFPILETIDDEIDELEDQIVGGPSDEQLQRMFRLKRTLVMFRRIIAPQRDIALGDLEEVKALPGLEPGVRDYFRDISDHLFRISELLDSYRDLVSGAMDVYLSTVSNRLNVVMKQLTIIATIFLPLTFVTGFFGQNFGWLVNHINSIGDFLVLGFGGLVVPCVALYWWFRKSGFLS